MDDIGERLAELRRQNNLNQEELAEKMHLSRQAISKWERGESMPDISNLIALSEIYGVSIDYIAKGDSTCEEPLDLEESASAEAEEAPGPSHDGQPESPAASSEEFPPPRPEDAHVWEEPPCTTQQAGQEPTPAKKRRSPWRTFPYPVFIALLYLVIGFAFGGWHPWWILFFTIPFYYWIVSVITNDPKYVEEHPQYKAKGR